MNGDGATRCAGCGLPIALGEEPAPRPVDTPLSLDRRVSRRGVEFPARRAASQDDADAGSPWEMAPPDGAPVEEELAPPEEEPPVAVVAEPPAPPEAPWADEPVVTFAGAPPPEVEPVALLAPAIVEDVRPAAADFVPPVEAVAPVESVAHPDLAAPIEIPAARPAERDPVAVPVHRTRAPAWRRALSWLFDAGLLGALVALLLLAVTGPVAGSEAARSLLRSLALPVALLVALLAFAWQWLGVALAGGTPGLLLAGLRVVGPDGQRPAPGRAAVRAVLGLPAAGLLGAGLLLALFTRSGRGAHDLGAGTWVVLPARGGRR